MADPFITPLLIGVILGAAGSATRTVKRSEIDAWIKEKRPDLAAPKGIATITREEAAGDKVIVTAAVYSLQDSLFSAKRVLLDSRKWTGDRLEPALERKFSGGQPSFSVKLTRTGA